MFNYQDLLRKTINDARELHIMERSFSLRSIEIIGELECLRAAPNVGMTIRDFATHIGLSEDQYLKRAAAARVMIHIPEARPLIESGAISISHLVMVSAKITRANHQLILENIKGKSLRDIKLFLSRVTHRGDLLPAEETIDLKITLKKSEVALLERARQVLAAAGHVPSDTEVLLRGLDDLLVRRDPQRKAERAAARQGRRARQDEGEEWGAGIPTGAAAPQHTRQDEESAADIRPSAAARQGRRARQDEEQEWGAGIRTGAAAPQHTRQDKESAADIRPSAAAPQHTRQDKESAADIRPSAAAPQRPGGASTKQKQTRTRYIPAKVRHEVWLRDGARCTHRFPNGDRCRERMMLELDHRRLFCRGGAHSTGNWQLKCRYHNGFAAAAALGRRWYQRRLFTSRVPSVVEL